MHDIREIANSFLADVIDVTKAVQPDPRRPSNFMEGHAELVTPFNRYQLSVYSPHGAQPPEAPPECQSLGTIWFRDTVDDTTVIGPRSERVLLDISQRVHYREYKDAISVARRELAEAGPDSIKSAQAKFSDLVARGAKYGITIDAVPMAPGLKTAPALPLAAVPAQAMHVAPAATATAPALPPAPQPVLDGSEPFVGAHVLFVTNPGEQISGMQELPAVIVRVHPDRNHVSLLVFIDDSETIHRLNIPRRGSNAGGGRIHQFGVWDFNPSWLRDQARLRALEESVTAITALSDRIALLEAKPRRSRPAKPEGGGEAEAGELAGEGEAAAGRDAELDLNK